MNQRNVDAQNLAALEQALAELVPFVLATEPDPAKRSRRLAELLDARGAVALGALGQEESIPGA